MPIRVCLAGATGWAGSALARSIAQTSDIELVAAVSRSQAKRILGDVLSEPRLKCPIYATAQEALSQPCDVFVEFTLPEVAKAMRVLVIRGDDGKFHAFRNRCTHIGHRRLDPVPETGTVQCCSVGKSTYTYDGKKIYGPPTGSIKTFKVEVEGDRLIVYVGK